MAENTGSRPGTRFALDHKVLSRTTSAGSNAVLVVVECFFWFSAFYLCIGYDSRDNGQSVGKACDSFLGHTVAISNGLRA